MTLLYEINWILLHLLVAQGSFRDLNSSLVNNLTRFVIFPKSEPRSPPATDKSRLSIFVPGELNGSFP